MNRDHQLLTHGCDAGFLFCHLGERAHRLAEQLHQEEQLREKDKQKTDALLRQAQLEEAERHRKADEALQRAECVRQRRLLKVNTSSFSCTGHLLHSTGQRCNHAVLPWPSRRSPARAVDTRALL